MHTDIVMGLGSTGKTLGKLLVFTYKTLLETSVFVSVLEHNIAWVFWFVGQDVWIKSSRFLSATTVSEFP